MTVETVIQNELLVLRLSADAADSQKIVDYRIMQGNGEPLPSWISKIGSDLLIGTPATDLETLVLRIKVLFSDGSYETRTIEINIKTGEVSQQLQKDVQVVPEFGTQLAIIGQPSALELDELGHWLKASVPTPTLGSRL
jgi:hypothetical protein